MGDTITMSKKELSRLEIIQRLQRREISQGKASEILDISVRQVKRLLVAFRLHGPEGLVSKKRGKVSNNRLSESVIKTISRDTVYIFKSFFIKSY